MQFAGRLRAIQQHLNDLHPDEQVPRVYIVEILAILTEVGKKLDEIEQARSRSSVDRFRGRF